MDNSDFSGTDQGFRVVQKTEHPFLNYLRAYRRKCGNDKYIKEIVKDAAQKWKHMSRKSKTAYGHPETAELSADGRRRRRKSKRGTSTKRRHRSLRKKSRASGKRSRSGSKRRGLKTRGGARRTKSSAGIRSAKSRAATRSAKTRAGRRTKSRAAKKGRPRSRSHSPGSSM